MTEQDAAASEAAEDELQAQDGSEDQQPVDELEALRAEAEEHRNMYLRAAAELENMRKRNAREVENARKYGVERLIAAVLPVRDSLEAALASVADQSANITPETLIEGDRATLRLLDQALETTGIREIDPHGEPFDPEQHEAMSMLPSPTAEPNSVVAVVQKGYALHDRIVRPARVVVAQATAPGDEK